MSESHIDLDHFRQKLIDLRDELEAAERVSNADADTVELDQQHQGRLSRMDALGAQAMTKAAQQRRREALQRVHKALARIAAATTACASNAMTRSTRAGSSSIRPHSCASPAPARRRAER